MSTRVVDEETSGAPLPTTLAEVRDLALIPVWSDHEPSYAGVVRQSRWAAYGAAARGDIPVVKMGRLLFVPVPALRRMLGDLR